MEENLEALNLDAERIIWDRDFCADIAKVYDYTRTGEEDDKVRETAQAISATNYRRAAAHSLLLGDRHRAEAYFLNAARTYNKLENPYALVMRAFTSQPPRYGSYLDEQLRAQRDEGVARYFPFQSIYTLLVYSMRGYEGEDEFDDPEYMRSVWEDFEAYRARPIGILGLPLGSYLDLTGYFDERLSRRGFSLAESLLPFVNAYNTAVRQTIQDRFHWRRLALPFHPAEPDIFGILLLVQSALRSRERSGLDPGRRTDQSFGYRVRRRRSKGCREQHHAIHRSSEQRR
jgi:hypothetical protein